MSRHYILEGHEPVPVDIMIWAKWIGTANRIVQKTYYGDIWISTVFLGSDHRFILQPTGAPLLFETMVFGLPDGHKFDQYCERCSTWEQAEEQHERICKMIIAALGVN